ncbi:MAG: NAD(P)/FAD-dependent oxidoreductase, partial [Flavobacterium sp.]
GEGSLHEITITNNLSLEQTQYKTSFVFVCIGGKPNTRWAEDTTIVRDKAGYLVTGSDLFKQPFAQEWDGSFDPNYLQTSLPSCFAAGDVRHNSIKRVASAVGEGAMAVTFVHQYLHDNY